MNTNEVARTEAEVDHLNRGGLSLLSASTETLQQPDRPVMISPFSIDSAFAMLWLGIRGRAKDEIGHVLGFTNGIDTLAKTNRRFQRSDVPKLLTSNSIWADNRLPLDESYVETVRQHFSSSIFGFDNTRAYDSARQINEHITNDTYGLIRNCIDPGGIQPYLDKVNRGTGLILVNSLYFLGRWENEFDPNRTEKRYPFNCLNGTASQVEMMQGTQTVSYDEGDDYQVLSLPYQYERSRGEWIDCSFVAVLPTPSLDVKTLLRRLSEGNAFRDMMRSCRRTEVKIKLPKLDIEFKTSLCGALQELGAVTLFSPSEETFSTMIMDQDVARATCVNEVIHAVRIKMDEQMTEAAAASCIEMLCGCMGGLRPDPPIPEFTADHPYLGFIVDHTSGLILLASVIQGIGSGRTLAMSREQLEKREKDRRHGFESAMDEWRKSGLHPWNKLKFP